MILICIHFLHCLATIFKFNPIFNFLEYENYKCLITEKIFFSNGG